MTDKPITVLWWQIACMPRPIKVATTSHLKGAK